MLLKSLGYTSNYSSKAYTTTANFGKNKDMSIEDEVIASKGFTFLKFPTSIPEGINLITQCSGGGCLNMHPTRAQEKLFDTNGSFGESTFMAFG